MAGRLRPGCAGENQYCNSFDMISCVLLAPASAKTNDIIHCRCGWTKLTPPRFPSSRHSPCQPSGADATCRVLSPVRLSTCTSLSTIDRDAPSQATLKSGKVSLKSQWTARYSFMLKRYLV